MSVNEIISGTPWWVWVLFVYVVIKGFQATRERVMSLYKMMIIPIIFVFLTLHTLLTIPLDFGRVVLVVVATLLGVGIGFWEISRLFLLVDKQRKLIQNPGSLVPLILILIIFCSKYYFGYTLAVNPDMDNNFLFVAALLIISGICTGIFIGRAACYICRFISLPHQDLSHKLDSTNKK